MIKKGSIIYVKTPIEGYYSGYGITPKFYLTPDIPARVKNPKVPCVWVRDKGAKTFILVEFFSPVTKGIEQAAIMDIENISSKKLKRDQNENNQYKG